MRHWLQQFIVDPKTRLPRAPAVFAVVAIVSFLQIPSTIIVAQSLTIGILINEIMFVAGTPLFIARRFHLDMRRLFPMRWPTLAQVGSILLITMGTYALVDVGMHIGERFFPLPEAQRKMLETIMAVRTPEEFVWKLALLCALPALCEEILFRGFCQTALEHRYGTRRAWIIAALLFAVLHGNPWYMHLYFLLGLCFSGIYVLTKNLWLCILAHALNNAATLTAHAVGYDSIADAPIQRLMFAAGGIASIAAGAWWARKSGQIHC